mgnify:CR=1 FL=1
MAKFKTIITTLFVAALIPWFAGAQEIPSPDEAFKVIDFYMNGKGNGMVLMESKVCKDIHREGSLKYECKNEIIEFGEMQSDGSAPPIFHKIKKGDSFYVWMSYLVPVGAEEYYFIRYNFGGETKYTSKKSKVSGSHRYRSWKKFTPKTVGAWEVEVFHDSTAGPIKISSFVVTVE